MVTESVEKGTPVCIIFLDVDGLKSVNDTYGHDEGDNLIKEVAGIMKNVKKHGEIVMRYGGDEFAIICMRQSEEEVEKLKIRVKEEVNILNKLNDKPYDISISIGSSKLDPKTDNIESAITKADEQLYSIKSARKEKSE
jgi:diguanylate cyclase (GGDEF)-like protein